MRFFLLLAPVLAWSGGYAPGSVECPSGSLIRSADSLSDNEAEWLEQRNKVTNEHLEIFLSEAGLDDFDAGDFIKNTKNNRALTIGIAFSGGGYRAMLSGAGQLAALDNRTKGAHEEGLGGLLQASTYLVGLSGGNWLVGSLVMNNDSSVQDMIDNKDGLWNLEHLIVNYGGWNPIKAYEYYKQLWDDVLAKEDAHYPVSLTDTWGRALLHQFFPESTEYGNSLVWSLIQDMDSFVNHEMPFPIVVADGRTPGETLISGNSTVFEVNPFELGSWDPSLYSFTQTKYLGTKVKDGKPMNGTCVAGFDNAGYIMGTSSTLFNQFVLQINTTSISSTLKSLITKLLDSVAEDQNDIAVYEPNPFRSYDEAAYHSIVQNDTLYLVDGGEDGQNVPLYPLIQRERGLDVIFAYDNSADTDQLWPNGTSLIATFERQHLKQGNGTIFPYVPDAASFRNLNLTARPAFFGCDAKNLTNLLRDGADEDEVYDSPLIIYTANRPFTYFSNTSTFKLSYEENEKLSMIKNGFEVASRLNGTLDDDWKTCVACAIIRREQERQGIEQSDQCKQCFENYCWDLSLDDSTSGINFTSTGTTNGDQQNDNRTVSAGFSLYAGNQHSAVQLLGFMLVAVIAFTCTSF